MPTWNSRGLRGSTLEEFINRTNEKYAELARIISGRGTPVKITVEKMEKDIKKTPRCPK